MRAELTHDETDLKKIRPDQEKRARTVHTTDAKLSDLVKTISTADDGVFAAFCQRIGVADIREYEDVQLKMAKEETEAMAGFSAQLARFTHM